MFRNNWNNSLHAQTIFNDRIEDLSHFSTQVLSLLAIYSFLTVNRTATNISSYGSKNKFVLFPHIFVKKKKYSHNHIAVSSCNVGNSITDIFASSANIQLHLNIFSLHKIIFLALKQLKWIQGDRFNLEEMILHSPP